MTNFLAAFATIIYGTLSGFDRIRFRGTQRHLAYPNGLDNHLWNEKVLLKDFKEHATKTTERIWADIESHAKQQKLDIYYVRNASQSKEKLADQLAKKAGRTEGLVAILSAVEPCQTYFVTKSKTLNRLELQVKPGKCLHYYHYFRDAMLGPCHVRFQTWYPFSVFVCVNGREMLAQRMTREGMAFRQRDNCFSWVEDIERAQKYLDEQKSMLWSEQLTRLLSAAHPMWRTWPGMGRDYLGMDRDYYWSGEQTEWATDVMFHSQKELKALVPGFIEHSITTLGSANVMQFLGHHVNLNGQINGHFHGEVGTDMTRRVEGTRVSFRVNQNSVKFYDKQGSVLRVETTINNTKEFKSFRANERDPEGEKDWRPMRKGVSDLPRRAEISQASNERVLESLASVVPTATVAKTVTSVSRRKVKEGRPVRALNVLGEDRELLEAIGRGEYLLNGFRNRDVRASLGKVSASAVSHRLRLLRSHGVIKKVSGTHRYHVTASGRELLAAVTKTLRMEAPAENRETPP